LLSMCTGASAFVAAPSRHALTTSSATTTTLDVASLNKPNSDGLDSWSGKPLNTHESTTPVTDPKFSKRNRMMMKDVVLPPSFSLTWAVALLGPLIMSYHPCKYFIYRIRDRFLCRRMTCRKHHASCIVFIFTNTLFLISFNSPFFARIAYMADGSPSLIGIAGGGFHILFATLLWVQTSRVRCVFEKDSFEFYNIKGPRLDYENGKAELCKKPDNYVSGTPNRWKYDTIINYGFFPSEEFPVIVYFKETETPEWKWNRWFAGFDSYGNGQPHFFPGICNVKKFKEQMELRGVKRKPIPTLKSTAAASAAKMKN